jgi:hypothetical protein
VQPPEFTLSLLYKQTPKKETTSIHIIDYYILHDTFIAAEESHSFALPLLRWSMRAVHFLLFDNTIIRVVLPLETERDPRLQRVGTGDTLGQNTQRSETQISPGPHGPR